MKKRSRWSRSFWGREDYRMAQRSQASQSERKWLEALVYRVHYPRWSWTPISGPGEPTALIAFCPDPTDPHQIRKVGPWLIPAEATDHQVVELAVEAIVEVEGEEARARISITKG